MFGAPDSTSVVKKNFRAGYAPESRRGAQTKTAPPAGGAVGRLARTSPALGPTGTRYGISRCIQLDAEGARIARDAFGKLPADCEMKYCLSARLRAHNST